MYTGCLKNLNPIAKRNYAINFFILRKIRLLAIERHSFCKTGTRNERIRIE